MLVGARGGKAEGAGGQGLLKRARHIAKLGFARRFIVVRPALAHGRDAQRRVGHLGADIHDTGHGRQGIEIVGKTVPTEIHACGEHGGGNVLHRLHESNEEILVPRAQRRDADAAIAEHGGGDAMPRRRREIGIPGGLAVVMGVDIDPAGEHQLPLRIDLALARPQTRAHGTDGCRVHS